VYSYKKGQLSGLLGRTQLMHYIFHPGFAFRKLLLLGREGATHFGLERGAAGEHKQGGYQTGTEWTG
jgi:hypothetical protein